MGNALRSGTLTLETRATMVAALRDELTADRKLADLSTSALVQEHVTWALEATL